MRRALPLCLTACAVAPEAPVAEHARTSAARLVAPAVVTEGEPLELAVTGLAAGARVRVHATDGALQPGVGACPARFGGACLDAPVGASGWIRVVDGEVAADGSLPPSEPLPFDTRVGPWVLHAVHETAEGQVLVPGVQLEVQEGCPVDAAEPDEGPHLAPGLRDTQGPRWACPGEYDLHRVEVPAHTTLAVDATFDGGDLDLELRDRQRVVLARAATAAPVEPLRWLNASDAAETVWVRAYAHDAPAAGVRYELSSGFFGWSPCLDDLGEDDDTPATARPLEAGVGSGWACLGDPDVFDVGAHPRDDWFHAQLVGGGDEERFELRRVARGSPQAPEPGREIVDFLPVDLLQLHVGLVQDDLGGGGAAYALVVDTHESVRCEDDAYEPELGGFTPPWPTAPQSRTLCGQEFDSAQIDLQAGETAGVVATWAPSDGTLDLELRTESGLTLEGATRVEGEGASR